MVSPGRMVATLQVPLQSHHCEASRLENCCEFLSLYLLRACSWLKIGFIKVSVAPCSVFFLCLVLFLFLAVLRIRDISVRTRMRIRIRILRTSVPDADPGGPKTYGSGSGTLVKSHKEVEVFLTIFAWWWKDPEPDLYLWLTDPEADPGSPKTYGAGCGSGSTTLFSSTHRLKFYSFVLIRLSLIAVNLTGIVSSECRIFWKRLSFGLSRRQWRPLGLLISRGSLNSFLAVSFVVKVLSVNQGSDPHWFNADPDTDPDPAFFLIADPDSGSRIRIHDLMI